MRHCARAAARPRRVWFHRCYLGLTGGHLKHAHYFGHARAMPGCEVRIAFTAAAPGAERLWRPRAGEAVERWTPVPDDVLFAAGID